MNKCKKLKRVNIMVEADVYHLFKVIVKGKGKSSSQVIRGLIFEYLFNHKHILSVKE